MADAASDINEDDHIVTEQANRLFDACDRDGKGFVVGMDLGVLDAYLSEKATDHISGHLEEQQEKFLTREKFILVLRPFLARPPSLKRSPVLVSFSHSIDLSDDMPSSRGRVSTLMRPLPSFDIPSHPVDPLVHDLLQGAAQQLQHLAIHEILVPSEELGAPLPLIHKPSLPGPGEATPIPTKERFNAMSTENSRKPSQISMESGKSEVLSAIGEIVKRNTELDKLSMTSSLSSSLDKEDSLDVADSAAISLDLPEPHTRPLSRIGFSEGAAPLDQPPPPLSLPIPSLQLHQPDNEDTQETPRREVEGESTLAIPSFLIEQTETPTGERDMYEDLEDSDREEERDEETPIGDVAPTQRSQSRSGSAEGRDVDDSAVIEALSGSAVIDGEVEEESEESRARKVRRALTLEGSEEEANYLLEALRETAMDRRREDSEQGSMEVNASDQGSRTESVAEEREEEEEQRGEEEEMEEMEVPRHDTRPALLKMGEVVTLADELAFSKDPPSYDTNDNETSHEEEHPSPREESYPYRVENCSPIEGLPMHSADFHDHTSANIIKRRHFRPLLPDLSPEGNVTSTPQSLADELNDAHNGSSHKRPNGIPPELDMRTPDRIFKVVFVGDSAVGKTCFLHRFCHNRFRPLFNATIGVDFTVKTIQLRDRLLAVQLWDTAGQERFRSITKQYFRKADGVVLMYDVTSEQSFLHVRNWIDSVKQGVDESTAMCLVDLYASDQARTITYKMGKDIAKEFNMLFFETSAFTGYGIHECMTAMAERLQKREEDHLEEALKLEMAVDGKKRSWCCA